MAAAGTSRSHSAATPTRTFATFSNPATGSNNNNAGKTLRETAINTTASFAHAWLYQASSALKSSGGGREGASSFINRSTIDSFRQKNYVRPHQPQPTSAGAGAALATAAIEQFGSEEWVLPYAVVMVAKILYISIISFAVVGNLCVLFVYLCTRRKRTYFRYVLVNLAVADLLLACIIPFTMVQVLGNGYWPFSDLMCKAVLYMQLLSVCASVFTLVMVTSSWRWIMSGSTNGQRRGANNNTVQTTNQFSYKPFVVLWLMLAIVSCVQLKIAHIEHYPSPTGNITKCLESGSISPEWGMGYTLFTFGLTYAGPLVHLVINFALIRRKFDKLSRAAAVGRQLDRASTPASLLMLGVQHVNPTFSHNQNSDASSQQSRNSNNNNKNETIGNSPSSGGGGGGEGNGNDNKRNSDDSTTLQRNNNGILRTTRRCSDSLPVQQQRTIFTTSNNKSTSNSLVVTIDGSETAEDGYKLKVRRKVLRIFKIIVIIFAVCWAPLQLFFLVFTFVLPYAVTVKTLMAPSIIGTLQITYILCHLLAMSSACVNPVVLSLTHRNFRNDLKSLTEPVWRYIQPRRLLAYTIHFCWLACCCFLCNTCCRDNTYYAEGEEGEENDEGGVNKAECEEGEDENAARGDVGSYDDKRYQLPNGSKRNSMCYGAVKTKHSSGSRSKTGSSASSKSPIGRRFRQHTTRSKSPEELRKLSDLEYEKAVIDKVISDKSYCFYRQTQQTPLLNQQPETQQVSNRNNKGQRVDKSSSSTLAKSSQHISTHRSSSAPSSSSSLPPMRTRAKPITQHVNNANATDNKNNTRKAEKVNEHAGGKQQQKPQQKKQGKNKQLNSNLNDNRSQKKTEKPENRRASNNNNSSSRPNSDAAVSGRPTMSTSRQMMRNGGHHHSSAASMLVDKLRRKSTKRSKSANNTAQNSHSSGSSAGSSSESHYAQAHETTYTEEELREGVIILKPSQKHHTTISSLSAGSSSHGGLLRSNIPLVILSSVSSPTHRARHAV